MEGMQIILPVIAAVCLGFGFVLQQHEAERAPLRDVLSIRLFADLLRSRRWVAGICSMIAGQVLSAFALNIGTLIVVEPLLTTNLLFALALAVPFSHQRLRLREFAGACLLTGGVVAFTLAVHWQNTSGWTIGTVAHWPYAAAIGGIALMLIVWGRRRSAIASAVWFATAAGLIFGIQDALTRTVMGTLTGGRAFDLVTSWPLYALLLVAIVGLLVMQSAFRLAPLKFSLPPITAAEPLVGIALGIVIFGDHIRIDAPELAVEVIGLVGMVAGVFLVGRSRVLTEPPSGAPSSGPEPNDPRSSGSDAGSRPC